MPIDNTQATNLSVGVPKPVSPPCFFCGGFAKKRHKYSYNDHKRAMVCTQCESNFGGRRGVQDVLSRISHPIELSNLKEIYKKNLRKVGK